MKFVALINREVALSKGLNGLAHMAFGMGHRLNADPDVQVFFATTDTVRNFRTMAVKLKASNPESVVTSDFPNTMVGMSTGDLLKNVADTPEPDVTYFGSCMISDEICSEMRELLKTCQQLKDCPAIPDNKAAKILPPQETDKYELDPSTPMKISLLINQTKKVSLSQYLNSIVITCLNLARKIPVSHQRLLNIKGTGEHAYGLTNISFHSLAVVSTKLYDSIQDAANKEKNLTVFSHDLVTLAFGTKAAVEAVISPKGTRLFSDNLKESELVNSNMGDSHQNELVNSDLEKDNQAFSSATTLSFFSISEKVSCSSETSHASKTLTKSNRED